MDSALDKNAGDVWFTQPHAVAFADINQDGILDMIVGKRHHSHFQYADPDNWGMPVLYVYRDRPQPEGAGRRGVRARARSTTARASARTSGSAI